MPSGLTDVTLTVGEDGDAASELIQASRVDSFSMKCDNAYAWKYEMKDRGGFVIASSEGQGADGILTGACVVPVDRRCDGFQLYLHGATPGEYTIRIYH